jgi:hypothetical protein
MSSSPDDPNETLAHRIQEKFDFYFLALTFTILWLSLQTSKFGQGVASDLAELIGWLALLTSGISGLSRIEWLPGIFHAFSYRTDREEVARGLRQKASLGPQDEVAVKGQQQRLPVQSVISKLEDNIANVDNFITKLQGRSLVKYRVQKVSFLLGLVALVTARALPAVIGLFGYAQRGLDLGSIVGHQLNKADLQALSSAAGEKPEMSRSGDSEYLVFNRGGLQVELKDDFVENIWIDLRASPKHGTFAGPLPFGVQRTDDRASLNRKFGLPWRSGGGDENPFRAVTGDAYVPIHDNWRFGRVELHVEYDHQSGINLLSLMRVRGNG